MGSDLSKLGYEEFLGELKERIRNAQVRAALAVNRELVLLYWQIGQEILQRQQHQGGEPKSLIGWQLTFGKHFQTSKAFLPVTCSI